MAALKFDTNVPRELVLQAFGGNGIFGKPEESKRYTNTDGTPQKQLRFSATEGPFYVSDFAGMQINDQLQKLGVQAGDRIAVTKREVPVQGKKPVTRWLVERVGAATPAAQPPATNGNSYHAPVKIPYHLALKGMIQAVDEALAGKQWSDTCRQALVSTAFIQAGKDGVISWSSLPQPSAAEPSELEKQLADSIVQAQERKAQQPSPAKVETATAPSHATLSNLASPVRTDAHALPQSSTKPKPWSTFGGMVKAFEELKNQIPWPLYYDVLGQYGTAHANQFPNAKIAWECYQKLGERVREYLTQAGKPDTFEHFESQEGGWQ